MIFICLGIGSKPNLEMIFVVYLQPCNKSSWGVVLYIPSAGRNVLSHMTLLVTIYLIILVGILLRISMFHVEWVISLMVWMNISISGTY